MSVDVRCLGSGHKLTDLRLNTVSQGTVIQVLQCTKCGAMNEITLARGGVTRQRLV